MSDCPHISAWQFDPARGYRCASCKKTALQIVADQQERIAELERTAPEGPLMTVELGDGSTAVSDVYYGTDNGPVAGVAFSKTQGKVGQIHAAATTDDLEAVFLRVLTENPDSLAVVKAAFIRAEATLRTALNSKEGK